MRVLRPSCALYPNIRALSLVLAMPLPVALPQPNGSPPLAALIDLLPRRAHPLAAAASSRPPLPNPSSSGGAPFSQPLLAHLLVGFFLQAEWPSPSSFSTRLLIVFSPRRGRTGGVVTVTPGAWQLGCDTHDFSPGHGQASGCNPTTSLSNAVGWRL